MQAVIFPLKNMNIFYYIILYYFYFILLYFTSLHIPQLNLFIFLHYVTLLYYDILYYMTVLLILFGLFISLLDENVLEPTASTAQSPRGPAVSPKKLYCPFPGCCLCLCHRNDNSLEQTWLV